MHDTTQIKRLSRPCPICLTENHDEKPGRYSRDGWSIVDCKRCGFAHMPLVPSASELEENLAWEKTFIEERVRRKTKQPILQRLDDITRWRLRMLPRTEGIDILNKNALPGPALDLGCGTGGNLAKLGDQFVPHGIEISKGLANIAQTLVEPRGGKIIQATSLEGLESFPDNFFTAALLRSYLEHDWQAREVLEKLFMKMSAKGLVVVKVPNYGSINRVVMGPKWCGFRLPDHVNYFDKHSLQTLARNAGFQVRMPLLNSLPTDDNMLAILSK